MAPVCTELCSSAGTSADLGDVQRSLTLSRHLCEAVDIAQGMTIGHLLALDQDLSTQRPCGLTAALLAASSAKTVLLNSA